MRDWKNEKKQSLPFFSDSGQLWRPSGFRALCRICLDLSCNHITSQLPLCPILLYFFLRDVALRTHSNRSSVCNCLPQSLFMENPEVKVSSCNAGATGDVGSIPGSETSPRGGFGNPSQYSCLENPTDIRDWWATVHGVAKSWTRLNQLSVLSKTIVTITTWLCLCTFPFGLMQFLQAIMPLFSVALYFLL